MACILTNYVTTNIFGRGWASSDNNGSNHNFYLSTGNWFRTISPESLWEATFPRIWLIDDVNAIASYSINNNKGGVL